MTKEEEIVNLESSIADANVRLDSLKGKIEKLESEYRALKYKTEQKKNNLKLLKNRPEVGDEVSYYVETCQRGCCWYSWTGSVQSISDDYKLYDVLNFETGNIVKNIARTDLLKRAITEAKK